MRRIVPFFWVMSLGSAGCYASHGLAEEGASLCEGPTQIGPACDSSFPVIPSGVCRLANGTTIAFGNLDHQTSCLAWGEGDARVVGFEPHGCTDPVPLGRVVASCGETSDTPTFVQTERPPGRRVTFDLTEASCALARPMDGEPAEPWAPFVEANVLCRDPYAWCGSPMVLELRQRRGDPCDGGTFTHRCTARVEGARIVLRAEGATEIMTVCETALGDRIARCIVPPLPAGRYEVVDETSRALGEVTVPGVRPTGDLEPTCSPI